MDGKTIASIPQKSIERHALNMRVEQPLMGYISAGTQRNTHSTAGRRGTRGGIVGLEQTVRREPHACNREPHPAGRAKCAEQILARIDGLR